MKGLFLLNTFLQEINNNVLVFDGSKGTMLQKMGLGGGECPELWNIEHPEEVRSLYNSYIDAGSDVIQTNTFGANREVLRKFDLQDKTEEINIAGVKLAKEIAGENVYIAASIGPTGRILEPSGDLTFDQAYEAYKEQVIAVTKAGADIINFETITDLAEMRAAILAARENSTLPIIASMSFEQNGYSLMGNPPETFTLVCQSLGADIIGVNCSTGPDSLLQIIKKIYPYSNVPICTKANAGLPEYLNGTLQYLESPDIFKNSVQSYVENGVRLIGGCCGTTPEHIIAIKSGIRLIDFDSLNEKLKQNHNTLVCSATKLISVDNLDEINVFKFFESFDGSQLKTIDSDIIIEKIVDLNINDFEALYLNLNALDIECDIVSIISTIQSYCRLPIIFHSSSPIKLKSALRAYNGKACVLLSQESDINFDLIVYAKKYGCIIKTDVNL